MTIKYKEKTAIISCDKCKTEQENSIGKHNDIWFALGWSLIKLHDGKAIHLCENCYKVKR